jgi:hypothetical protein
MAGSGMPRLGSSSSRESPSALLCEMTHYTVCSDLIVLYPMSGRDKSGITNGLIGSILDHVFLLKNLFETNDLDFGFLEMD